MRISRESESGINVIFVSAEDTLADIEAFTMNEMGELRGKPSLWDFNAFDTSRIDPNILDPHIFKMVKKNVVRSGDKAAHIASSDIMYGLLRMYQQMRDVDGPVIVEIFRTKEKALSWLMEK